jgi:sugar O-acyltransferase (sialic acid O-acetyltransferase NeuD family)
MKTLAIIGAGHLGQQIAYYALQQNVFSEIIFFDDFCENNQVNGHRLSGGVDSVQKAYLNKEFDELIIGIGYKHLQLRSSLFNRFKNDIPFATIIHSSCWIDPSATIGKGTVIYPGCVVDLNAVIAENCIINASCTIAHDTHVGQHCFLSPRVALAGFIVIGEKCILGINSTVIDNLKIVEGTQIGGGTVVIKSIDVPGLYVGNPQRFIR